METNLGTVDRAIRGVVGATLTGAGLFLVRGVLAVVLCLVGAVLVYSGAVGFCHVCKVLHVDTSKKV